MVEISQTRVYDSHDSIPALQVPYFASCVVDCLHDSEQRKVFDWEVPEGVFQNGFVQDQSSHLSLTCDYFNSFGISQDFGFWKYGEGNIDDLGDVTGKTYIEKYFCNGNYRCAGKFSDTGEKGTMHDEKVQDYVLESQRYRAFFDFDREIWKMIEDVVNDAKKMHEDGKTLQEIGGFLKEVLNGKIIGPYTNFIRNISTSGPKDKKLEISYEGEGKPKKVLVLHVRNIPYQDFERYTS